MQSISSSINRSSRLALFFKKAAFKNCAKFTGNYCTGTFFNKDTLTGQSDSFCKMLLFWKSTTLRSFFVSLQSKTNFSKMYECFFICLIVRHRRKTWNFKSKKFLKNKFFIKHRQLLSVLCFSEIFCQKPVLIGKQLCWSSFFTKVTGSAPVTFLKSDSRTSAFLWFL